MQESLSTGNFHVGSIRESLSREMHKISHISLSAKVSTPKLSHALFSFLQLIMMYGSTHAITLSRCVWRAYAYNRTLHMLKPDITHNRRAGLHFEQNRCTDFFNERTVIRKLKITHAQQVRFATPVPNSS